MLAHDNFDRFTVPIPEEVCFFFEEINLPDARTVYFVSDGTKYSSRLECDEDGVVLELDDNFHNYIMQYCFEKDYDVCILLTKARKNVYSATFLDIRPVAQKNQKEVDVQRKQDDSANENTLTHDESSVGREPETRSITVTQYQREKNIADTAKRRANGVCALCGQNAPFLDKDGQPYLESHHIVFLSEGGEDSVDNTVALCPNCHRKVHILQDPSDKEKLLAYNKRFIEK